MKLFKIIVWIIILLAVIAAVLIMQERIRGIVTFKDNFQKGIKPAWSPKTSGKWVLATEVKNKLYRLKEPGESDNGVRRPTEYSLAGDLAFTDFTLQCRLRCDMPVEFRYRDMVIIFGYRDDTHFYYVHFSNISDDFHNAIMLVNGDYRQKLNRDIPEPTLIDTDFHKVKVKRKAIGDIEVHFDGKLVMKAHDITFIAGKVGIGSFDDVGCFDDVKIKGKVVGGGKFQLFSP